MTEAAVIGTPISHSRSPAIFSFLAAKLGRADFKYSATEVLPAELPQFLAELRSKTDAVGVNVTTPHKEALLRLLDDVAHEARTVGAVNVIQAKGGKLYGYNTDVLGIFSTLQEQACRVTDEGAWVWGAGGAARAVAFVLGSLRARYVYLENRDSERARKVADELGSLFPNTSFIVAKAGTETQAQPLTLIVNATPLGMKGSAPAGDFFKRMRDLPTKRGALAFDLIYNPERTPFLHAAEELGLNTVSGLDMLIYQALATWEIWFGPFASDQFTRSVKEALALHLRERPIFLTGFMGVGKSVVGMALASKLGWDFLDIDEAVVRKAGMPIPKLFESLGEVAFRKLESEAVAEAATRTRTVVSLGGGALINPANFVEVERSGSLVCLEASLDYLVSRLGASSGTRPLLAGLDGEARAERIRALLEARQPIYDRAAFKVTTDGTRPADVAQDILRLLFTHEGFKSVAHLKEGA